MRALHELSGPAVGALVAATIALRSAGERPNCAPTSSTLALNAASSAKGSAAHTRSSTVQPSARSGFRAAGAQPLGQASAATGIESAPVAGVLSPPPATFGALASVAAAPAATLTVIVIGGYDAPGASTSERVQRLVLVPVHVQPGPEAAVGAAPRPGLLTSAESPLGSVSVTVTALPSVGSAPTLVTVRLSVPEYSVVFGACARRNVARACAADSVSAGAACAGAAPTSASAMPTARDNLIATLSPYRTKRQRRTPPAPSLAGGSASYSAKAER